MFNSLYFYLIKIFNGNFYAVFYLNRVLLTVHNVSTHSTLKIQRGIFKFNFQKRNLRSKGSIKYRVPCTVTLPQATTSHYSLLMFESRVGSEHGKKRQMRNNNKCSMPQTIGNIIILCIFMTQGPLFWPYCAKHFILFYFS